MKLRASIAATLLLAACSDTPQVTAPAKADVLAQDTPAAITTSPWTEVVISVPDFEDVPRLFAEIGNYTVVSRSKESLVLTAPNTEGGRIRFILSAPNASLIRPVDARAWDTGCYWSLMLRAKNIGTIIDDAKALGWSPLTELAYLEFGPSRLHIVVLRHEKTGIQVQLYERLTTPLPEGFPEFDRLSRPFNVMQMAANRDAAYAFFTQGLGFDTYYHGGPTLSKKPEVMPLGIPVDKVMTTPYYTGIVTPKAGLNWGRMEMIEVRMNDGSERDFSKQCEPHNIGLHTVRFAVEDIAATSERLTLRELSFVPTQNGVRIKSPDGANIEFYQK